MKQGKTLLINNIISLLLFGASGVLGTMLLVFIWNFSLTYDVPYWMGVMLFGLAMIASAILIPLSFCFFSGKWCLKKVKKGWCFVSPLSFLVCSFCYDILVYASFFENWLSEKENSFFHLTLGFLGGNSYLVDFLMVNYFENGFLYLATEMGISVLYYLLLVLGNMSGRKGLRKVEVPFDK